MANNVNNEVIEVILRDDGIVMCRYKSGLVLDSVAKAQLTIDSRKQVCDGLSRYVCADVRNLVKVAPEANDYLGKPEAYEFISCLALIVKSRFHQMFVSFYFKFNKPPVPCQVFHKENSALEWLRARRIVEN